MTSPRPQRLLVVSVFLVALSALLAGYMFMGRGFAHVGRPPFYVGEVVLALGLVASIIAVVWAGARMRLSLVVLLLLGFMVLGLVRTVPYLGTYGVDALRDAVLWGYALFALMIYLLADRPIVLGALRLYGWIVPLFALWLPICYNLFAALSAGILADERGSNVPLVFFKSGDMAVHIAGSIAFLVLSVGATKNARTLLWRVVIAVPLLWTTFLAGATNRGGLLTVAAAVLVIAAFGFVFRRSRNWVPFLIPPAVLIVVLAAAGILSAWSGGRATVTPPGAAASGSAASATTEAPSAGATSDPAPASRSLVANPGFELGTLKSGLIEGWTPWAGIYNIVADGAYQGAHYASIENTGDAWTASITSGRFLFQAGQDISISLRAKAIAGSPIVATYVDWYDASGALISTIPLASQATRGSSGWHESTAAFTAPPGTTHADIQLYEAAGHATLGLDEVIVRSGHFVPQGGRHRSTTIDQIIANITSIFSSSSDPGLEGSKAFRLKWWGAIIDYTVFGKYFWTGKGFGVNLADADGFQVNPDDSLRTPHNTHITTLARMGVPGLVLWLLLQGAFAIGLLRAVLAHRRMGDTSVALVGACILVYWVAMMVDTSFDPYLEGPQGGIWFWTLFGLGMVVMRLSHRRTETAA